MLPNLPAIETRAGRIAIDAKVKSTRYPVQGLVTAIVWAGYFYAIQVDNRHSDEAAHYELLSEPTYQGFNYVNSFAQEATSGTFEVILPGEGDRIYFADDAHQAISLIGEHQKVWGNGLSGASGLGVSRVGQLALLLAAPHFLMLSVSGGTYKFLFIDLIHIITSFYELYAAPA